VREEKRDVFLGNLSGTGLTFITDGCRA
jgi:hypothetical protein